MSVMSGAWVSRATLQAADGAPMPTRQTSEEVSAREAAMVIISSGVKSGIAQLLDPVGEHIGTDLHDVGLHPGAEAVAVGGNLVPLEIALVVAVVVAVGIAWMCAA